jgi:alkyl hydroperoxide reductase subunit F
LKLNEFGEIPINCACETGIPGLYAAGDVTNVPAKQIVVAAGEGAKAALQAHLYLQKST